MKKLLLIDGNSIVNRAFYGIMGNKMLMTSDGTYTNAVYGFLSILFRIVEDLNPEYLAVAFDLKGPTKRHELYKEYKATRKGMPDELASQLPILKEVLQAMNIHIVEQQGYEADDIIGTLAKKGEEKELETIILTGDKDSFQLISNHIKVRMPRTKAGKTETEDYTTEKILEEYGLTPTDLIEVKGLMGDSSDNIPGIPGVGEKTALTLIKDYKSIDGVYENIEEIKGKLKEKLAENKELAYLSKELGTIDTDVPVNKEIEDIEVQEWDKVQVLEIFKNLKFNRFIDRFNLEEGISSGEKVKIEVECKRIETDEETKQIKEAINKDKKIYYYLSNEEISIFIPENNKSYCSKNISDFKEIFENKDILKCGYKQKEDYMLLKGQGIEVDNLMFDVEIAGYILNSNINKYPLEYLSNEYLNFDIEGYMADMGAEEKPEAQMNLFDAVVEDSSDAEILERDILKHGIYAYVIKELHEILIKKMEEENVLELFEKIEMPLSEVLANMQHLGIHVDKEELKTYGTILKERLDKLTEEIYGLTDEEFNINSPKQLGEVLFEKLRITFRKENEIRIFNR
ncbi:MAG: hypothetical protein FWC79_00750 [Oscillospiraceae bacterium]|nr:hypothetical protein [Oscillospiraceae bacterium]